MPATLFPEVRPVEPILSYDMPPLQALIPGDQAEGTVQRLVLPGEPGLAFYQDQQDDIRHEWLPWGSGSAGRASSASLDVGALDRIGRGSKKRMAHRCLIPLARYSVPVRDADIWMHRWIVPGGDQPFCAAAIWTMAKGQSYFLIITRESSARDASPSTAPALLAEKDFLTWLRAPWREAIALIQAA